MSLVIDSPPFENASNCEDMPAEFVKIIKSLLTKSLDFVRLVHSILDLRRCRMSAISIHFMDTLSVY